MRRKLKRTELRPMFYTVVAHQAKWSVRKCRHTSHLIDTSSYRWILDKIVILSNYIHSYYFHSYTV